MQLDTHLGLEIHSPVYSLLTDENPDVKKVSLIMEAYATVHTASGIKIRANIKLDSCNSRFLAGEQFLYEIKSCYEYGLPPIRMRTTSKQPTSWKRNVGKFKYTDENGIDLISLVYADPDNPDLILMDMNTLLDTGIDLYYHGQTSRTTGVAELRRNTKLPYDYRDNLTWLDPCQALNLEPKPPGPERQGMAAKAAQARKNEARVLRRSTRGTTKAPPPAYLNHQDEQIRLGEECTCNLRQVQSLDIESYNRFVDGVSELTLRENHMGLFSANSDWPGDDPGFIPASDGLSYLTYKKGMSPTCAPLIEDKTSDRSSYLSYKQAMFPTWAPLIEGEAYKIASKDLRCYMTEIQLQAILDAQGDPTQDLDLDMMTTKDGKRISKFSLEAMTIGEEVTESLTKLFHEFNSDYVGMDSVFPLKSGAPKILTAFRERPFRFELRDEYTKGPRPRTLPSVRGTYYYGKPATRKILEHFVRTTPVVSRCDHPRCLSRLVIVPKREPGSVKSSDPTGYRVTMNAVINSCIKPTASITPLATDEIKKLHHYKYYLQLDGSQAFWSIPLDEDSKKLLAFQTHEGVFAWDRLTMGAQPSSSVQQGAYHEALDQHIPWMHRHRFALMADDIAAGANNLDELFELYKMLIKCLSEAGIQVKPQKLKFGIREIKFHNYKISKERTAVKEENLEPIRQMGIPTSVTEVKAFLGCCGQMANYCQYYALVAEPLHRLTRKNTIFPKPWLPDTDYDIAFHKLKGMMLDSPLFLWNKVSNRRIFIEVDSSQEGWGACVYQYADDPPMGVDDEGRYRLLETKKNQPLKRVIAWISKAHTPHEKTLPCFYRETLARLLALEYFRNLIETQEPQAGSTVYTDHLPAIREASLSNKGQLSAWKIHETADLNAICQTLHRSGITMDISNPLSRMKRIGEGMNMVLLPLVLKELFSRLPDRIKDSKYIRVSAERDTAAAARIVQRWRNIRR